MKDNYKKIKEAVSKQSSKSYYEHIIESVDNYLTFDEKIYLLEYLSSSVVKELDTDILKVREQFRNK